MPIWPPGGWPRGAARLPVATGRCLPGGSSETDCRSARCWRNSPPFAARLPLLRRRGSTMPSGSRRRCEVRARTTQMTALGAAEPCAFEHLFAPVVEQAEALLWAGIDGRVSGKSLNDSARACLRHSLLKELCNLCAPAIYERFVEARKASAMPAGARETQRDGGTSQYDRFVADMKRGGFRRLFEDKPVLLRLIASITRQWIDTSREFVLRLDADLATIRRDILHLRRRQPGRRDRRRSLRSAQWRPLGPDRHASRTALASSTSRRTCASMSPGTRWSSV